MKKIPGTKNRRWTAHLAVVSALAIVSSVEAKEFQWGDWDGSFDNTITYGISWRAESRDPNLVGAGNGGNGPGINTDDGNLNFDSGDIFSNIVKGTSEMQLDNGQFGVFGRVKYWYDYALENGSVPQGNEPNGWVPNTELSDSGFNKFAKFSGVALLDLFVYGNFDLGDYPLDLRLGRQVVNWGEATFIQGINRVNPIDVSAFRRPGAQIKEGLLPVAMLYGNLGLSGGWSVEGFYQLKWESTPIDACGTYFSDLDFAAQGCDRLLVSNLASDYIVQNFASVAKDPNIVEPSNGGQFGLALRNYVESVDTEFGLYYQNLHNRTPVLNVRYNLAAIGDGTILGVPAPAYYQVEYPEDISIWGLTAATNIGVVAVSAEVSARLDQPIGVNGTTELTGALGALNPAVCPSGIPNALVGPFGERACAALVDFLTTGDGLAQGWDRFDVYQGQSTALYFWDQGLGSQRVTLIGEVAWIHVANLPPTSVMPYGRNPIFGVPASLGGNDSGLLTTNSWGYRIRAAAEYPNVFAGVALTPTLAWSQDVKGNSPAPTFIEGRKAFSLGLNANYLTRYRAGISYTIFSGGKANSLSDRDFLSLTFSIDI